MIDTHCHIDFFDDPIATAKLYEKEHASCVMVSMLPSHYELALPHLKSFKNIHPALGMHPLQAEEGHKQVRSFLRNIKQTTFVGEIGLDLSIEGKKTRQLQENILDEILPSVSEGKFVSVHSRNAHEELAEKLREFGVGPVCFHYFIGGDDAAMRLAADGHYFSINQRMINGRQKTLAECLPRHQVLVESDGPFLTKIPLSAISSVYEHLASTWALDKKSTADLLELNFQNCRTGNVTPK